MVGRAPPPARQEAAACLGLDVREVLYLGIVVVVAEAILFVVRGAENVVSGSLNGEHA